MQEKQQFFQLIISICTVLNKRKVRYLMVGGAAVGIHGYYRQTTDREGNYVDKPDVDIWFDPRFLNYQNLLNAFDDLGFDSSRFREEAHPFPKSSFFRFKPQDYSLDFLPRVAGLQFGECYQRCMTSIIDGVEISVISLGDLFIAKKAAGRPKDLEDIRQLEFLHNLNKGFNGQK